MDKRVLSFGLAAAVAAVLLYYSLRGIAWGEVGRILAGASPGPLIVACGLGSAALFLRALRWRVLLNARGDVPVRTVFWATAAGYFGNNFLPIRAGEIIRALMVGSRTALDNTYVLATVFSERVADVIALVTIAAVVLLVLPNPPGWLAHAARPFGLIALGGALTIAVLPLTEKPAHRLIAATPLTNAIRAKLSTALEHALAGMRTFHHAGRLAAFAALTAAIWAIDALGAIVGGRAIGMQIPWSVALLLIAGLGLGSSLPSTPGYVGIYQFVAVTVLTPFGFSRTDAIAFIILAQALSYVVMGVWGAVGFARYRGARRSV